MTHTGNRVVRVILFIVIAALIAVLAVLFLRPKRTKEDHFVNFKIEDIQREKLTEFVVRDKKILEELPQDNLVKKKDITGENAVAVTFKNPEIAEKFLNEAAQKYGKINFEKDVPVKAFVTFDDPYYSSQTNLPQMELPAGWNYLNDTSGTKIAIVDTGIRGTHEDLNGKVLAGYNELTSSAISANSNSDDHGHGTAMASTAAAAANNGKGIVGAAYNSSVIPVKVLNSSGNGLASDVASGINWATSNGAKIINLSLGGSDYSQTMHDAIQSAVNFNILVVAASGNEGGSLSYPAWDSLVLSVGSVNSSNQRSSFSNYGDQLDLVAPGEAIWVAESSGNSNYAQASGTSVSAAEVSGLAALSVNWNSGGSVADNMSYLENSALKLAGMGGSNHTAYYGYGLADYNRLQSAAGDYHYSWAAQNVYPTMAPGQSYNFQLTVRNSSKSTWRQGVVNLGTSNPQNRISSFTREGNGPSGWISPNRIMFQESSVAPGATATYSFWMRNDSVGSGHYREYFQVVADNIGWMEDYGIYWEVTVPSLSDLYHYSWATQNVYPTLSSGQAYNFQVTVRNTGSATWQRGVVNLATSHGRDRISAFTREGNGPSGWISPNRIMFQEPSVAPGATATYSFWMRNNSVSPGHYREYFQLVADNITWMEDYGIYWEVTIPTTADLYHYTWVTQNVYPTLSRGQSYNFQVTVRNTGSATWNQGQVNLGTSHSRDRISAFTREGDGPSGWISPDRIAFQESSVAPGATATYSFWMRNDSVGSGHYREYFQVVADNIGWMEDYGIYWDVTVP